MSEEGHGPAVHHSRLTAIRRAAIRAAQLRERHTAAVAYRNRMIAAVRKNGATYPAIMAEVGLTRDALRKILAGKIQPWPGTPRPLTEVAAEVARVGDKLAAAVRRRDRLMQEARAANVPLSAIALTTNMSLSQASTCSRAGYIGPLTTKRGPVRAVSDQEARERRNAADRRRRQEIQQGKRQPGSHGESGYAQGCRCATCSTANSSAWARRRAGA